MLPAPEMPATWKALYSTRPHTLFASAPTGVLNAYSWTAVCLSIDVPFTFTVESVYTKRSLPAGHGFHVVARIRD